LGPPSPLPNTFPPFFFFLWSYLLHLSSPFPPLFVHVHIVIVLIFLYLFSQPTANNEPPSCLFLFFFSCPGRVPYFFFLLFYQPIGLAPVLRSSPSDFLSRVPFPTLFFSFLGSFLYPSFLRAESHFCCEFTLPPDFFPFCRFRFHSCDVDLRTAALLAVFLSTLSSSGGLHFFSPNLHTTPHFAPRLVFTETHLHPLFQASRLFVPFFFPRSPVVTPPGILGPPNQTRTGSGWQQNCSRLSLLFVLPICSCPSDDPPPSPPT